MICILKYEHSRITGWIIASDPHDARRQADAAFESDLAQELYRMEFAPGPGMYLICNGPVQKITADEAAEISFGFLMLVS
jgi:hypothetical protein